MTQGTSLFSYATSVKDFLNLYFQFSVLQWKTKCQQQELSLVKVLTRLIKKGNIV